MVKKETQVKPKPEKMITLDVFKEYSVQTEMDGGRGKEVGV